MYCFSRKGGRKHIDPDTPRDKYIIEDNSRANHLELDMSEHDASEEQPITFLMNETEHSANAEDQNVLFVLEANTIVKEHNDAESEENEDMDNIDRAESNAAIQSTINDSQRDTPTEHVENYEMTNLMLSNKARSAPDIAMPSSDRYGSRRSSVNSLLSVHRNSLDSTLVSTLSAEKIAASYWYSKEFQKERKKKPLVSESPAQRALRHRRLRKEYL